MICKLSSLYITGEDSTPSQKRKLNNFPPLKNYLVVEFCVREQYTAKPHLTYSEDLQA